MDPFQLELIRRGIGTAAPRTAPTIGRVGPAPIGNLANESALPGAVALTDAERAADVAGERAPANLAELDLEISRAADPNIKAVLEAERARLAKSGSPTPAAPTTPPPTWDEVLRLPEMQGLGNDEIEAARNQYFVDVVAPQVPTDQLDAARAAFDADTRAGVVQRAARSARQIVMKLGAATFGEDFGKPRPAPPPAWMEQGMYLNRVSRPPAPLGAKPNFTPIPDQPPVADARLDINRAIHTLKKSTFVPAGTKMSGVITANDVEELMGAAAQGRADKHKLVNVVGSSIMRGINNIAKGSANFVPLVVNTVVSGFSNPHLEISPSRMATSQADALPGMASYPAPTVAAKNWDDLEGAEEHIVWLGSHVSEQIPQMAGMLSVAAVPRLANAYLGMLGASSAGSQYAETAEKELDPASRMADAWVNGTIEALAEKLPLETFLRLSKWVKSMPSEAAATALGRVLQAAGVTVRAGAAIAGQAAVEGTQEGLTQIGQNLSARYIGGDRSVNWNDHVKEATIIGTAAGGVMGSVPVAARLASGRQGEKAPTTDPAPPELLGDAPTTIEALLGESSGASRQPPAQAEAPAQRETEKPQERLATVNRLLSEISIGIASSRAPGASQADQARLGFLESRAAELLAERAALEKEINPDVDLGRLQRQNRDRGRAAAVAQMQSIANDPDYDRLSTAPIPDVGSPMVSIAGNTEAIPETDYGKSAVVTLADGTKIPVRYAVVEAGQVMASHDVDGTENKDYFGVHPRGSIVALTNGRVAGLQAAYSRGKAQGYLERLTADTEHGVSPDVIIGKKRPMLVRVYDDQFNQIPRLAQLSNTGGSAALSDVEKARNDAAALDSLDGFAPSESGDVTASSNLPFARRFIQSVVPENERAEMLTAKGLLSQAGAKRIRFAVFAKAYGGGEALHRMAESTDDNVRLITSALMRAAPTVAKLRDKVQAGALHNLDITPELLRAIEDISRLRAEGTSVGAWLAQADIFGGAVPAEVMELLDFLEQNARTPRRIVEFLERYLAAAEAAGSPAQGAMFAQTPPTKAEIVSGVRKEMGDERQGRLREGAQPAAAVAGGGAQAREGAGAAEAGARGTRAEGRQSAGAGAGEAGAVAVDQAAQEAATSPENDLPEPTDKKGHVTIGGLDISIENPVGSVRSGETRHGVKWQVTMAAHYGYVLGTEGIDGDQVDVFVKEGTPEDWTGTVFVVNQNNAAGKMDEHKAMIGYDSLEAARAAYLENYTEGWESRIRSIAELPIDEFKTWAKDPTDAGPKGGELVPDRLQEELDDALSDLGAWVQKNLVPKAALLPDEAEQNLVPILARLFTVAIKKGYRDFAAASKFVMGEIRRKAAQLADLINEKLLRQAFAQAGGKEAEDAGAVRGDAGQVQARGAEREGREEEGGANIQRPQEARAAAGNEVSRRRDGGARGQLELSRLTIRIPVTIEGTGEKFFVERNAAEALSESSARLDRLRQLMRCVGG